MRLALALKVVVAKEDMVVAEEDAGGADEDKRIVVFNHQHTTDQTIIV